MKKQVKWVLWGAILAGLVAYGVFSAARPLRAELFTVEPRAIEKKFTESGIVSPRWQQDFYSMLGARVLLVNVAEGDQVRAGDVLVSFDTQEIDYQIAQLRGQLSSLKGQERQAFSQPRESQVAQQQLVVKQAENQVAAARVNVERTQSLYEAGAVSRSVLEDAQSAYAQVELLLEQQKKALTLLAEDNEPPSGTREQFSGLLAAVRAQISLLEYQKKFATVTAPVAGTVALVHVKEGTVVGPGTPLLSIFQPGEYEVEVFLLAEDIAAVSIGMDVRVVQRGLAEDFLYAGTVTKIASTAVERLSTLGLMERRVKVTVALAQDVTALRPGYTVDVEFVAFREDNRLVVPKTLVFPYKGGSAVWKAEEGKAVIQPVHKGLETDNEVVIVTGVAQGDQLLQNPRLEGLKQGVRVTAY